jgi:hypothetical protein
MSQPIYVSGTNLYWGTPEGVNTTCGAVTTDYPGATIGRVWLSPENKSLYYCDQYGQTRLVIGALATNITEPTYPNQRIFTRYVDLLWKLDGNIYFTRGEYGFLVAPTPSVTPSITPTPSVTPSISPSISISPSVTPTPSISVSNTPTVTPSTSVSNTPTVTPSISVSNTPTVTPTASPSNTPTPTPSISTSNTPTPTVTPGASASNTPSLTPTPTPTQTLPLGQCYFAQLVNLNVSCTISYTDRTGVPDEQVLFWDDAFNSYLETWLCIKAGSEIFVQCVDENDLSTPSEEDEILIINQDSTCVDPGICVAVTASNTPTPTNTPTPSITPSISPSNSITPSITPTPTITPTKVTSGKCYTVFYDAEGTEVKAIDYTDANGNPAVINISPGNSATRCMQVPPESIPGEGIIVVPCGEDDIPIDCNLDMECICDPEPPPPSEPVSPSNTPTPSITPSITPTPSESLLPGECYYVQLLNLDTTCEVTFINRSGNPDSVTLTASNPTDSVCIRSDITSDCVIDLDIEIINSEAFCYEASECSPPAASQSNTPTPTPSETPTETPTPSITPTPTQTEPEPTPGGVCYTAFYDAMGDDPTPISFTDADGNPDSININPQQDVQFCAQLGTPSAGAGVMIELCKEDGNNIPCGDILACTACTPF